MKTVLNPIRAAAKAAYDSAHSAWVKSTQGNDEADYLAADATLEQARRGLVAAESAHPTAREISRRQNTLRLENRGLTT